MTYGVSRMSKIKKADSAAKTAESYWSLLVTEGSLGRTLVKLVWPLIGAGVFAGAAQLTKWMDQFSPFGWVAAAAVGFALTLVMLAQIEAVRLRRSQRLNHEVAGGLSEGQVSALINAHMIAMMSETIPATFATHAQMHGQDVKIAGLTDQLRAVRSLAETGYTDSKARFDQIEEDIRTMRRRWEDWTASNVDTVHRRFKNVDDGFRSLFDRERLTTLADRVAEAGEWLTRPRQGIRIEDWDAWTARRAQFQADLDGWLEIADVHRSQTSGRVRNVTEASLEGRWPEDEHLPTSHDRITAYRLAASTYDRFKSERTMVDKAVLMSAFESPSLRNRQTLS